MAERLTGDYDLSVLRITLAAAREPAQVRFQLQVTRNGVVEDVEDIAARADELCVPDQPSAVSGTGSYRLPDGLAERVVRHVEADLDPDRPLWLHLVKPYGTLGLLPWEPLLQPHLGIPLLRLPDFPVEPTRSGSTLDVVLVASDPAASPHVVAEAVMVLTARIVTATPVPTFVHVFPDADVCRLLPKSGWPSGRRSEVILYDPTDRPPPGEPAGSSEPDLVTREPWLHWIRTSLRGHGVDVVHFLAHGQLLTSGGALALSESPAHPGQGLSVIGTAVLNRFTTHLGAWSVAFSSPVGNRSESGMRLAADTLAQLRPCSVLYHDLSADARGDVLAAAYAFLYALQPAIPPVTPHLFVYCQPWQVRTEVERGRAGSRHDTLDAYAGPTPKVRQLLASETVTPSWVAAAQRYAEQCEWRVRRWEQSGAVDEGSQATVAGVRDTIEVIKSVLDEYADTPGPPPPPPSGTVVGIAPDTPDRAPAASPPATSPEEAT